VKKNCTNKGNNSHQIHEAVHKKLRNKPEIRTYTSKLGINGRTQEGIIRERHSTMVPASGIYQIALVIVKNWIPNLNISNPIYLTPFPFLVVNL
jgi:hypothetical protein